MLIDILSQHPQLIAADELFSWGESARHHFHFKAFGNDKYFRDDAPDDPAGTPAELYIADIEAHAEKQGKRIAFKLLDFQSPEVWDMLTPSHHTTVIYLKRDIPLEGLVSEKMGHKTGIWHAQNIEELVEARSGEERAGPIYIEPAEYLAWLRRIEQLEERLRIVPNLIQMNYSFLTSMLALAQHEIFLRLGVDHNHVSILRYNKIADKPIWRRVLNYRQLESFLSNTAYRNTLPPWQHEPGITVCD